LYKTFSLISLKILVMHLFSEWKYLTYTSKSFTDLRRLNLWKKWTWLVSYYYINIPEQKLFVCSKNIQCKSEVKGV
jgi:hypothetical protein